MPIQSTMQDVPLTIGSLVGQGEENHSAQTVLEYRHGELEKTADYLTTGTRARQLAASLLGLGLQPGDRVATLLWNSLEHLECYLGVPYGGLVLHTVNIRLAESQILSILEDAQDSAIICDAEFLELGRRAAEAIPSIRWIVVVGKDWSVASDSRVEILDYDSTLASTMPLEEPASLDEDAPAAMCYTSGTTGEPKGVVYSHRAILLHAFAECSAAVLGLTSRDVVLPVVPMFHVNAWNLPYASWLMGARLVFPGSSATPMSISECIRSEAVTITAAVPTIFGDILRYADDHPVELGSLRLALAGGASVPEPLIRAYEEQFDVYMVQAWGMTETLSLATVAHGAPGDEDFRWRATAGCPIPGVRTRLIGEDGQELAKDGVVVGELEVQGPWVTGRYHRIEGSFDWLPTGDVACIHPNGYVEIRDRLKDSIKSGGEWISSVVLESIILDHPRVREVAVIGIPDDRWQERPLALVVLDSGDLDDVPEAVSALAEGQVPRWWLPDRWVRVDALPRTSVGKVDKETLRASADEDVNGPFVMDPS